MSPSLLGDDDPRQGLLGIPGAQVLRIEQPDPEKQDKRRSLAQTYNKVSDYLRAAYSQQGGAEYGPQKWGQNLPGAGTRLSPNFRTTDPSRLTVDPMELRYDYGEGRTTLPPQNWIGPEREA